MVLHDMRGAGGWQWNEGRLEAGKLSLTVSEFSRGPCRSLYLRFHGTTGKYAGEYMHGKSRALGRPGPYRA